MKKILILSAALLFVNMAFAQKSCCSASANDAFIAMASTPSFSNSHLAPLPFHFTPERGGFITFKTPDGKTARAYEVKGKGNNVVLLFHEWWGLNDYIQKEAEKLQSDLGNATVLALDLYDGKVATTPEEAQKMVQEVKEDRARAIIKGAFEYAGNDARLATMGWCFGGGWSLQAAIMAEKKADACVIYYGMPEKDKTKIQKLNAPVLGNYASQDQFITPDKVKDFEKVMKAEGKSIDIKFYEADHAFANPSNPKYNKEAGADAYQRSLTFLKSKLR